MNGVESSRQRDRTIRRFDRTNLLDVAVVTVFETVCFVESCARLGHITPDKTPVAEGAVLGIRRFSDPRPRTHTTAKPQPGEQLRPSLACTEGGATIGRGSSLCTNTRFTQTAVAICSTARSVGVWNLKPCGVPRLESPLLSSAKHPPRPPCCNCYTIT